jgi:membrane-bound metal-dependent hydrolase YbcI (DUF457 family)
MNSVTHFLTGYLLGRTVFKKENDHYVPFFCGLVAILPDIDMFLHLIIPIKLFEHAVFTHTIVGMLIITLLFTLMNWAIGRKFLRKLEINIKLFAIIALSGMISHLILDIFTFREDVWTTDAHLYFWPFWNLSFHFNAFFHQSVFPNTRLVRITIEVIYTAIIGVYIIFYQWGNKKENPFFMFNPKLWLNHLPESIDIEENKRYAYALSLFNLVLLGLISTGMIGYF